MLLRTLFSPLNFLLQYTLLFKFFKLPRNYPLIPFTPVQPKLLNEAVTYADNYRCFANDPSFTLQRQLPPSLR